MDIMHLLNYHKDKIYPKEGTRCPRLILNHFFRSSQVRIVAERVLNDLSTVWIKATPDRRYIPIYSLNVGQSPVAFIPMRQEL